MNAPALDLILGADGRFHWASADRVFPFISGGDGEPPAPPAELTIPEDVTALDDDALATMHASAAAALDELRTRATADPTSITADDAARATELNGAFVALDAEVTRRAGEHQAAVDSVLDLAAVAAPPAEPAAETDPPADPPAEPVDPPAGDPPAEVEVIEGAELEAVAAAATRGPVRVAAVAKRPTLNPPLSLAEIAANAPAPNAPARKSAKPLVLTAANGIRGFDNGQNIDNLADLADAFVARAIGMPISSGQGAPMQVASIHREFEHAMDETTSLEDADRIFMELIGAAFPTDTMMRATVAAGGWCAPSEIDYSFWGVEGPAAGAIDLPTVGIRRGGLRWPFSLNLADFFGLSGAPPSGIPSNATMPWEWTETDDILAATGSPTKACLRPPCPTFDEARLRVWGLCVLAGNLTEAAYPEVIRRFITLTQIAHDRVMNRRHILQMVAHPSVTATAPVVGASTSAFTHWLGATEMYATQQRYKYGAPLNAVVELVLPAWVRAVFRNDLARRNAWSDLSVSDAFLTQQFDQRNIRVQWVEDWQSLPGSAGPANTFGAATAPTSYPTSWSGLMYFPGHFFKGTGFNLNLGVVRDSVLNKANDHTAAWSEEGTLIGARGAVGGALLITPASAVYPEGTSGAQVDQSAASA